VATQKSFLKSHCELTNFIFGRIVSALNRKVLTIYKVRRLAPPENRREPLYGYLDPIDGYKLFEIYISAQKSLKIDRDEMGKTILHEALHIIFESSPELVIRRMEDLLWNEMSGDQKKMIKSYIPKNFSKVKPE